jgi:hypothetical protein
MCETTMSTRWGGSFTRGFLFRLEDINSSGGHTRGHLLHGPDALPPLLREEGVSFINDPQDIIRDDGRRTARCCYLLDPDGLPVELYEAFAALDLSKLAVWVRWARIAIRTHPRSPRSLGAPCHAGSSRLGSWNERQRKLPHQRRVWRLGIGGIQRGRGQRGVRAGRHCRPRQPSPGSSHVQRPAGVADKLVHHFLQ